MKIQEITSQHRRDFYAIFECEHCGATETHRPLAPRHAEGEVV